MYIGEGDLSSVLLDVDGVMTMGNDHILESVNRVFGTDYKFEDITDFEYKFMTEEEREHVFEAWENDCLYDDLVLIISPGQVIGIGAR